MLNQIIKTLQDAEATRRSEEEQYNKQAMLADNPLEKQDLLCKASTARGYANGLSLAVVLIKNKVYEVEAGEKGNGEN